MTVHIGLKKVGPTITTLLQLSEAFVEVFWDGEKSFCKTYL